MEEKSDSHTASYTETTQDITISVTPEFLPERSNPDNALYAYVYFIDIKNNSNSRVTLINRHWKVYAGDKQIADVKGEGVVGEQPTLVPGEMYQYNSWTFVPQNIGAMEGSFTFADENGKFFDVVVPRFDLIFVENQLVH